MTQPGDRARSMTIYWIMFGFAALMALSYPTHVRPGRTDTAQLLAIAAFVVLYGVVATLRYKIGGDWFPYLDMYDRVRGGGLGEAMAQTEPLFGFSLWFSSLIGTDVYLSNGLCAFILVIGISRVALTTREPWLAIVFAVPYLLIVVGMGYVRQAAAIGLICSAIASLHKGRSVSVGVQLALAIGFHAAAVLVVPLFAYALANRNQLALVLLFIVGAALMYFVIAPRLDAYSNYVDTNFESGGALPRILLSVVPSILLLLFRKNFFDWTRSRPVWIGLAFLNCGALVAYFLFSASTAVDRAALYFSPIQLVVFGNIAGLLRSTVRTVFLLRLGVIGIAATVQSVWLIFSTYGSLWVPYTSVLAFL